MVIGPCKWRHARNELTPSPLLVPRSDRVQLCARHQGHHALCRRVLAWSGFAPLEALPSSDTRPARHHPPSGPFPAVRPSPRVSSSSPLTVPLPPSRQLHARAPLPQFWRILAQPLAYINSSELLLFELLMYSTARHVERRLGSRKFAVSPARPFPRLLSRD